MPRSQSSALSYAFPIIFAILLVVIFANFLLPSGDGDVTLDAETDYVYVSPIGDGASVKLEVRWDRQELVTSSEKVLKNELVIVETGNASVTFPDSGSFLRLNTGTKLRYRGQEGGKDVFEIDNREVWASLDEASTLFRAPNFSLTPVGGTIFDISKNDVLTTVYVLKGAVKINGTTGSGDLRAGEMIIIQHLGSLTDAFEDVKVISDDIRSREWFIANGGDNILTDVAVDTGTPATDTGSLSSYILFESPQDGSLVESDTTDISGQIISTLVSRISIGGTDATITENTFTVPDASLSARENDLVYKVYNADGGLLKKWVLTLYSSTPGLGTSGGSNDLAGSPTYPADDERFTILTPKESPFVTTAGVVKIEGQVEPGLVEYITVNDFRLTKFVPQGRDWYYFANSQFGNLDLGTNLYEVKYFDAENTLVHSQLVIIKKIVEASSSE